MQRLNNTQYQRKRKKELIRQAENGELDDNMLHNLIHFYYIYVCN